MGAFYGSVQVRSKDRDPVKAAAEEVARQRQICMLIGPVLNGWIGVYPEGSGQDGTVSFAQKLTLAQKPDCQSESAQKLGIMAAALPQKSVE